MKLQEWKSKYEAAKGTPEHFKYVAEYQSKINGRWKFVGHGVPNPERKYDIKEHGGKVYLVSTNGNSRFVIKDGNTDLTQFVYGGNGIKEARTKHGLTQKQLSEITGIPERTIQNWEGGQRKCPDYVEKMVLDTLERNFGQPNHQTILEEIFEMLESDLPHLKTDEAKKYVSNVIDEIKDSL